MRVLLECSHVTGQTLVRLSTAARSGGVPAGSGAEGGANGAGAAGAPTPKKPKVKKVRITVAQVAAGGWWAVGKVALKRACAAAPVCGVSAHAPPSASPSACSPPQVTQTFRPRHCRR